MGVPKVAEGVAFAAAVADLAGDGQILLIETDGGAVVTQVSVGVPQVAEDLGLTGTVADLPTSRNRCFKPSDPFASQEPKIENVARGVAVVRTQLSNRAISRAMRRSPLLPVAY